MDYQRWWRSRASVEGFGEVLAAEWSRSYLAATGASTDDLVAVDPGNGFLYMFDLAGSLRDEPMAWPPRVVGVWGRTVPGVQARDRARMRGFPRPRRGEDDRGHLIAGAAGGGYDINLVPMDAALNRGWSIEGARFRALERRAAKVPGSLFFIRLAYTDHSDRPACFDVGVQAGDELHIDSFVNASSGPVTMGGSALRKSMPFPLGAELVVGCLDETALGDQLFLRGWQSGPESLTRPERSAVAGITGHVAESVAELLLDELGWRVIWHFEGPGRHGVDLVCLAPDDKVVAIEVKGTLVARHVPRLSRRELVQMSASWIDKADNPGMAELGLDSSDVYGAVVVINFADRTWRAALTTDFLNLYSVTTISGLVDLSWLEREER